jgi:DNA-binding NarL/FixJ family response regulator
MTDSQSIRVLIVDDRPIFRAGARGMLADFAAIEVVGEASNGREALEKARRLKPHVILMDLSMPEMDGVRATEAIKREDDAVAILALTVSDREEDVVQMVAAGATGYVMKDVGPTELAQAIQDAHGGRFLLDEEMARKVVIRLSQALGRVPSEPYQGPPLSPQERRILDMVIHGRGNKEIALALSVSQGTVKTHLRQLYRKLQVHSRAEAAAKGTHFRL